MTMLTPIVDKTVNDYNFPYLYVVISIRNIDVRITNENLSFGLLFVSAKVRL